MKSIHIFIFILGLTLIIIACKNNHTEEAQNEDRTMTLVTGNPAVDALTKKIKGDLENSELYYERSLAFADMGAFDNAIGDMNQAMRYDSLQPKYYAHLSDLFLNYSRSKKALATLQIAAERFPENIGILLKYSELLITLRQDQRAVLMLSKVMEKDNQNADAFFLMGLLMQTMGDKEKAKKALKEVVNIDPEITDAYILLGELYEEDDPTLALQYLDNALIVDPANINAMHSKAFFLQNHKRVPEALDIYRQINILDPDYAPAFLNAGILFIETDQLEKAYEQFNILVGIAPTDHLAYFYRGYTLYLQGKLEAAKADLEQSLVYKEDYEKAKQILKDVNIELKRKNLKG